METAKHVTSGWKKQMEHDISDISSIKNVSRNWQQNSDAISESGKRDVQDLMHKLHQGMSKTESEDKSILKDLKELVFEDQEILEYFSRTIARAMGKKQSSALERLQALQSLLDAWVHEQRLRVREKARKVNRLEIWLKDRGQKERMSEELARKLEKEIHLYQQLNEIKMKRQFGGLRQERNKARSDDVYDWVVDIDMLTNINKKGWKVSFSRQFWENSSKVVQNQILGKQQGFEGQKGGMAVESEGSKSGLGEPVKTEARGRSSSETSGKVGRERTPVKKSIDMYYNSDEKKRLEFQMEGPGSSKQVKGTWEGAIVSVVGLYDKGKTFVLNNLAESNLPSGKKVTTAGLSFKYVDLEQGTKLILLDTAGSYSPVKVENESSIIEKEATEMFILDLVFDISDYFIFVVNDFTSLDQRYLDKLTRSLQSSAEKSFREVIGRTFWI